MTALAIGSILMAGLTGAPPEPVIGGPCEGCELVFAGMPGSLEAAARIAPPGEPGEPLRIEGIVTDRDGRPAGGVIVYAYQTDRSGIYPPASTRHGRLRGWSRTDPTRYSEMASGRGGSGRVEPTRDGDGVWHVRRDISLGRGVPGRYRAAD